MSAHLKQTICRYFMNIYMICKNLNKKPKVIQYMKKSRLKNCIFTLISVPLMELCMFECDE